MTRLALALLGPFQANLDSKPINAFESDRVRALLAYLVVEAGKPHRRDWLAAMLWPEQRQEVALKNLRHVLYKLRQVLPGPGASDDCQAYLLVDTQAVQFNAAGDFHLDVTEFLQLIDSCQEHNHRRLDVCGSCHVRLDQASLLYRGDFLAGFGIAGSTEFEEWMLMKREALRQQAMHAFLCLSAYSEARGDYLVASAYARRQLELEPWNEEAHRHLMRLLWATNQRNAAIAQYDECRRILSEELDIEPGAQTTALYESILAGEYDESEVRDGQVPARSKHNLAPQVTPFVGREDELARIAERLESPDRRLMTLVGPGGIGKSRLVLAAASNHLGAFKDGVYFVPMAPVASADLLIPAIALALGVHFSGKEDEAQLLQYLADKELLLVVDNFEHLLEGKALLSRMIEHASQVSLLVTSRERLNLRAEHVIELSGLSYPGVSYGEHSETITYEQLSEYAAARLFLERAQARQPEFSLTPGSAPAILQICQLVSGLPLAIELAAVQVRHYSCSQIAEAIQIGLDFLATDQGGVSETHRSIRAVFNYSWGLLTAEEKNTFSRLSVFRGGWDSAAAEQVAGASRTLLRSLAGKSLIKRTGQDTAVRYDIHEVLRQYAAEQLDELPVERSQVRHRHAEYFLQLAEAAEPRLRGPDQETWLHRLDTEHGNMQAAIQWATESEQQELGLRLGGALWQFWVMHGHYATGRTLLSNFNLENAERTPAWAKALFGAGRLAMQQGEATSAQQLMERSMALYGDLGDDAAVRQVLIERARSYLRQGNFPQAEELASQALKLAKAAGDLRVLTSALTHLGNIAGNQSDYAKAGRLYTECLRIQRSMEDKWAIAWTLTNLGNLAHNNGYRELARRQLGESLSIRREIGDKWGVAACLTGLGIVAIAEKLYSEARSYIRQGLELRLELGDPWAVAESYIYYGLLEQMEGKYEHALDRWQQALSLSYAQQNHLFIVYCLTGLAATAFKTGNIEQAIRLLGVVSTLLKSLNVRLSPEFKRLYDEVLNAGETELGNETWTILWVEATSMTLDAAYEVARTL
jgi:predicted ATPase/DNA-binding SARP family transcriptional activator